MDERVERGRQRKEREDGGGIVERERGGIRVERRR